MVTIEVDLICVDKNFNLVISYPVENAKMEIIEVQPVKVFLTWSISAWTRSWTSGLWIRYRIPYDIVLDIVPEPPVKKSL